MCTVWITLSACFSSVTLLYENKCSPGGFDSIMSPCIAYQVHPLNLYTIFLQNSLSGFYHSIIISSRLEVRLRHVTPPNQVWEFWEGETCFKAGQSFSRTEASESKVEQHIKDQNIKCVTTYPINMVIIWLRQLPDSLSTHVKTWIERQIVFCLLEFKHRILSLQWVIIH